MKMTAVYDSGPFKYGQQYKVVRSGKDWHQVKLNGKMYFVEKQLLTLRRNYD